MEDEVAKRKRFRDTDAYRDRFVRALTPSLKHLWFYILDDCDHAGIWRVDLDGAALYTGAGPFEEAACLGALQEKVQVINQDHWFIPGFLKFQYGEQLSEKAGIAIAVQRRLKEMGLEGVKTVSTPTQQGLKTLKEEREEEVKVEEEIKVKIKSPSKSHPGFDQFYTLYPRHDAKGDAQKAWVQMKAPLEDVLVAIRWQLKSEDHLAKEKRYIPLPASWLRASRWLDEPPNSERRRQEGPPPKPLCPHDDIESTERIIQPAPGAPWVAELMDRCKKCGHRFEKQTLTAEDLRYTLKQFPNQPATKALLDRLIAKK